MEERIVPPAPTWTTVSRLMEGGVVARPVGRPFKPRLQARVGQAAEEDEQGHLRPYRAADGTPRRRQSAPHFSVKAGFSSNNPGSSDGSVGSGFSARSCATLSGPSVAIRSGSLGSSSTSTMSPFGDDDERATRLHVGPADGRTQVHLAPSRARSRSRAPRACWRARGGRTPRRTRPSAPSGMDGCRSSAALPVGSATPTLWGATERAGGRRRRLVPGRKRPPRRLPPPCRSSPRAPTVRKLSGEGRSHDPPPRSWHH